MEQERDARSEGELEERASEVGLSNSCQSFPRFLNPLVKSWGLGVETKRREERREHSVSVLMGGRQLNAAHDEAGG
ncbi:hypothetical protein KQX54_010530 [Cotesia glomerata]|uniref:Uncharacterized protein n=1 Tax=Cotesia glomerata TaxID=32391 RepID=A0AAV7J0K8_COTGL|nr:hypothetical protein KQX54_010530 [Cotesia glomerata]